MRAIQKVEAVSPPQAGHLHTLGLFYPGLRHGPACGQRPHARPCSGARASSRAPAAVLLAVVLGQ